MRVLCSGDLHLGRRSSRLPDAADPRATSAIAAWEAIVQCALAHRVDLVALSGDLVDQANRYYEAVGPLERGLRRLADAGVPVVAVAGNHDWGVLPALARTFPPAHFRLLGAGGRWERATFTAPDGTRLHVDGWSFPAGHVREDPLAAHDLAPADDAPVLGLLHADLDQPASSYAPVSLAALRARPVAMWLLGHVHAPTLHEATAGVPAVLYPGSPQPLDPGEPGVHGAWLVELRPGHAARPVMLPLASVRYDTVDVDVGAAAAPEDVRQAMLLAVRAHAARCAGEADALQHLSLRLRLTGRTPLHRALPAEAARAAEELALEVHGVAVHVERVEVATRPVRDLAALAAGGDAASWIARLLVALERGDDPGAEGTALLRAVGALPDELDAARPYRGLAWAGGERDDAALRALLAREADLLLDTLLAQREVAA